MVEKIQLSPATFSGLYDGKDKPGSGKNEAFTGLSLDKLGLSQDAQNKVMWAKSQFELNYQVFNSMNEANGEKSFQETFSFKASYEFLQMASGQDIPQPEMTESAEELPSQDDALTRLQEYFSPENTAQRILDMATSFFPLSRIGKTEGDTEAARQSFSEFIGAAINTGFQSARNILGDLPDDIVAGIDKTHSLVFSGLEDFVKNGLDPEKSQPGGVYERITAYRESRVSVVHSSKSASTSSYDAKGDAKNVAAESSKLSTKG